MTSISDSTRIARQIDSASDNIKKGPKWLRAAASADYTTRRQSPSKPATSGRFVPSPDPAPSARSQRVARKAVRRKDSVWKLPE